MMGPQNRYLSGLREGPVGRVRQTRRTVFLWIVLVFLFLAIWQFLSPAERQGTRPAPGVPATQANVQPERARDPLYDAATSFGVYALVIVLVYFALRRNMFPQPDPILAAETAVLREDLDDAVARARVLASPAGTQPATHHAYISALVVLARVAELRCEFDAAEQIYARALVALEGVRGLYKSQKRPILRAHRAFALAALGRLDEADADLTQTRDKDAFLGTDALVARARAIVLSKRGQHGEVLRHLEQTGSVMKKSLALRDRLLVRTVGALAKTSLEPAMRVSGAQLGLDADMRAWVQSIVPEAVAKLEAR